MYRIIYPNNDTIGVIIPIEYIDLHTLAQNIVPINIPYKIIHINDLPDDRTFRAAWSYDFHSPDGYGANYDTN